MSSYAAIKERCLKTGALFEDTDFPASDQSLFHSNRSHPFVWKRPKELCSNPKLFEGGASRLDSAQGMLRDSWLICAMASLATNQELLDRVVSNDQSLDGDGYCGAIYFRLWLSGQWTEVVIDDRLPTYNNKLAFARSNSQNEFWSALLEKACAKLAGSYEALRGGQTSEAMEDFTGGVRETIKLARTAEADAGKAMKAAMTAGSLMCACIEAKPNEVETKLANGLLKGHPYSVTSIKDVSVRASSGLVESTLVRLRSPFGNEREWMGPWSDGSAEWQLLSDDQKRELGLVFNDDGEFWMTLEDFHSNFTKVDMVHLRVAGASGATCHENGITGAWTRGQTAGGCRNFPDTFFLNPQYPITVAQPASTEADTSSVLVSVMQKDRRKIRKVGGENLTIGFTIYKLEGNEALPLGKEYFLTHKSYAPPEFLNAREVSDRFELVPGQYVIIPSTFKPGEEGEFYVRIFNETANSDSASVQADVDEKSKSQSDAVDAKLKPFFDKVSAADGIIDTKELSMILNFALMTETHMSGVAEETSRLLIDSFHYEGNGGLRYSEFKDLWCNLMTWKDTFHRFDKESSLTLNEAELRGALDEIAPQRSSGNSIPPGNDGAAFEDFLTILAKLKIEDRN